MWGKIGRVGWDSHDQCHGRNAVGRASSTKRRERRGPDSTRINANHANPRGFVLLRHPVWSLAGHSAKIRPIREDSCFPTKNAVLPSNATFRETAPGVVTDGGMNVPRLDLVAGPVLRRPVILA